MGALEGRVAIVTGAGRGIGREHALLLASEGARVVVNDNGARMDGGDAEEPGQADEVVAAIREAGGDALANYDDVTEWKGGESLVSAAVRHYGRLDVLVNNAGILRDRALVNMSEEDWDSVIRVHLKGHFVPLRHAATYWRERAKGGEEVAGAVINTSSTSGLHGNPGQANYGAAKAGIAALTIIAAAELGRYGVRVNGIVPAARTRLTEATPGLAEVIRPPAEPARFDEWDPANVAPLVAWLATPGCRVSGRMFYVLGGTIQPMSGWTRDDGLTKAGRWTIAELDEALPPLLD
jgi:NAD(P)-dependent dehydrogenase (short-subunit alcohol dehydrogenase family)